MRLVPIAFAALLSLGAAASAQGMDKTVSLMGPNKASRGSVTLTPAPDGVLLKVAASGLTPGWHAIHFHAKADCSDAKFTSAGGHVHQGDAAPVHGLLNPDANDSGDLTNIWAGKDGRANAEIFTTLVSLGNSSLPVPSLLDADGSALVIHAKPDDYRTQPIGGAGDRVACGVIQ